MVENVHGLRCLPLATGVNRVERRTGVEIEHLLAGADSWTPAAFTRAFRGIGERPETFYALAEDADSTWCREWLEARPETLSALADLVLDARPSGDAIEAISDAGGLPRALLSVAGFCSWEELHEEDGLYSVELDDGSVVHYSRGPVAAMVLRSGEDVAIVAEGAVHGALDVDGALHMVGRLDRLPERAWELVWRGGLGDEASTPYRFQPPPIGEPLVSLPLDAVSTPDLASALGCEPVESAIALAITDRAPERILRQRGVVVAGTDGAAAPIADAWWMYAGCVGGALYVPDAVPGTHRIDSALKYRAHRSVRLDSTIVAWPDLFAETS